MGLTKFKQAIFAGASQYAIFMALGGNGRLDIIYHQPVEFTEEELQAAVEAHMAAKEAETATDQ